MYSSDRRCYKPRVGAMTRAAFARSRSAMCCLLVVFCMQPSATSWASYIQSSQSQDSPATRPLLKFRRAARKTKPRCNSIKLELASLIPETQAYGDKVNNLIQWLVPMACIKTGSWAVFGSKSTVPRHRLGFGRALIWCDILVMTGVIQRNGLYWAQGRANIASLVV
jgi:hypothetical protein